jgi:hypothetical protein
LKKALNASQILLSNFTLLEKTEILEKSKIGEHVKDYVMKSPLTS